VNTANVARLGEDGSAVGLDWRVVAFTVGLSVATGLVFGLIPALHGSRADLTTMLKDSAGRSGTGFRQNKARSVLVVAEVGLAVVLLVGSVLLIRTVIALGTVDPGFDAKLVYDGLGRRVLVRSRDNILPCNQSGVYHWANGCLGAIQRIVSDDDRVLYEIGAPATTLSRWPT